MGDANALRSALRAGRGQSRTVAKRAPCPPRLAAPASPCGRRARERRPWQTPPANP